MADLLQAGKSVLETVLGKLPQDKADAARAIWNDPAAAPALEELGNAALRRADHSRALDEVKQSEARLRDHQAKLDAWWTQNEAAAKLGAAALDKGWTPEGGSPTTPEVPADVLRKKEFEQALNLREEGQLAFYLESNRLRDQHLATFGEALNLRELVTDPRVGQLGLDGVYQARFKERLDEKATTDRTKLIEAEVQKRLGEERRRGADRPIVPVNGQAPSPLDALAPISDGKPGLVQDAVAEYEALVAARTH